MMKFSLTISKIVLPVAIALTGISLIAQPSKADKPPSVGASGFWCDTSGTYPITKYQNKAGKQQLWIGWTSTALSASGYNPVSRCQQVSRRFEQYRATGKLSLITTGRINGQQVICAGELPGRCTGLLYTLKPGESPYEALRAIKALAEGQAGAQIRYESEDDRQNSDIPFVDVRGLLGEDSKQTPVTNAAPPTANTDSTSSTETPIRVEAPPSSEGF